MRALEEVRQKIKLASDELSEYKAKLAHSVDEYKKERWAMFKGYINQHSYGRLRFVGRQQRRFLNEMVIKKRKQLAGLQQRKYDLEREFSIQEKEFNSLRERARHWEVELKETLNKFYEAGNVL